MSLFDEIFHVIGKTTGASIIEVGANDGSHTQLFLDRFSDSHVFCFEPDPRACQKFRDAITSERAVLIEKAVGRVNGKTTFHQSGGMPAVSHGRDWSQGWDESGSIRAPKLHLDVYPWVTFGTKIEIEIIRLDDWSASKSLRSIDLIWADVQGAEEDLIEGARETLMRTYLFATEYSRSELYENAASLERILFLLPDFDIVKDYQDTHDGNVLLINRNFKNLE